MPWWPSCRRRTPVARAGLTEDRVVVEAERLVDEIGFSRLTLAALAENLGVRQPSPYKHIDGLDALQRSIAIRARRELADTLGRAAIGRAREDAIRAMRSALHGFVSLETNDGFGLPVSIDRSFDYLVDSLVRALDATDAPDVAVSRREA